MREPPPSRPMWVAVGGGSQSWCGEKLTTTESRPAPLGSDSRPTRTGQSLCASVTNEREETTMHDPVLDQLPKVLAKAISEHNPEWSVFLINNMQGELRVMFVEPECAVWVVTVEPLVLP